MHLFHWLIDYSIFGMGVAKFAKKNLSLINMKDAEVWKNIQKLLAWCRQKWKQTVYGELWLTMPHRVLS